MFNLENAIAQWRRQMGTMGIQSAEVLDELENHLRDDIEQQMINGVDAQKAFDLAAFRIGKAKILQKEFTRSGAPRKSSRQGFIEKFCFSTAAFVLMINSWTVIDFNMRAWERVAGFFVIAIVASYLAVLPFLGKLLSRCAYGRFVKAVNIFGFLTPVILILAIFAPHANSFGMTILPELVVWLFLAAVAITAFALALGNNFEWGGGLGGPPFATPFGPQPIPPRRPCPPEFGISIPPPDKFSPSARQSLEIAREEAARLGHDFIGTEHVLLGALKQAQGAVTTILQNSNLDREAVRNEIERLVVAQPFQHSSAPAPFTPRARKALRFAGKEAKNRNQSAINLEHILLGLLLEGSGVAAVALKNLGIHIEQIRFEISRASTRP